MNPYQTPYPTGPPQGMPSMPGAPDSYYGYQGYPNAMPIPAAAGYNMPYTQPSYDANTMPQAPYPAYGVPNAYAPYGPSYDQQTNCYSTPSNAYGQQSSGYGSYANAGSYNQNMGYGYPAPAASAYSPYPVPGQHTTVRNNVEMPVGDTTEGWSEVGQHWKSVDGGHAGNGERVPEPLSMSAQEPSAPSAPSALTESKPDRPTEPPRPKPRYRNDDIKSYKKNEDDSKQTDDSELKKFNDDWKGVKEELKNSSVEKKEDREELSGIQSHDPQERARYQKNLDALASLMTDVNLDEVEKKS